MVTREEQLPKDAILREVCAFQMRRAVVFKMEGAVEKFGIRVWEDVCGKGVMNIGNLGGYGEELVDV